VAGSGKSIFFWLRVAVLVSLLGLAVVTWRYVDELGGPEKLIPELLRVHTAREARDAEAVAARIDEAIATLGSTSSASRRIDAARALAEMGLARRKSYVQQGLSLSYGQIGAEVRIANHDNSDLHRALPALVQTLRSDNPLLRLEAAYALSHLQLTPRHAEYAPRMTLALAREHSIYIKTYLARAVGDIGPNAGASAAAITDLLLEDEPRLLAGAARAAATIGPAAYSIMLEARLVGLLAHPEPNVRDAAADALGRIGAFSPEAERALRGALGDDDDYVGVAAALALADIGIVDKPVLAMLARGYDLAPRTTIYVEDVARVVSIRRRATAVFTALGRAPEELVPMLARVTKESDDIFAREDAVALIGGDTYSESRARALVDLLRDPDTGVYYAAVDSLVAMGPDVAPHLTPLLDDADRHVRERASNVLAKLDVESAPVASAGDVLLTAFAKASEPATRARICRQLGAARNPAALPVLAPHLDAHHRGLRECALWAVLRIAPDHAVAKPKLEGLLREANAIGLRVVEDLAPEASAFVPTLIDAWSLADNPVARQDIAIAMARVAERRLLDFLLARPDARVMNGPVLEVVTGRLVEDLRHYRFQPKQHTMAERRLALAALAHLGVLTAGQYEAFAARVEDVEIGDEVRDIRRAWRALRRAARSAAEGPGSTT
jgi:HEAT repeat protein